MQDSASPEWVVGLVQLVGERAKAIVKVREKREMDGKWIHASEVV